jgi:integral membrane sensor domain MASE1
MWATGRSRPRRARDDNTTRVPTIPVRHARPVLLGAALAGAYVGAAKLGLNLDVSHGVITPVWAPSGIALAALLILGVRYWPAVAVGAFVANATDEASLGLAAGIAVGNMLAAVAGAYLVRALGCSIALDRVRAVLALVVGGALASTARRTASRS